MVYDIRDGLLSELKIDFKSELEKNKLIYGVVKSKPNNSKSLPDFSVK